MLLLLACTGNSVPKLPDAGDSGLAEPDPTDVVYDPSRVIEVEIEMPEEDFEALRNQSRNLFDILAGEDCMDGPFEHPYTWFEADVSFDGERFESVAIRKKGLIGSQESARPGLKLDLDDLVPDQRWNGVEHLTLNNTRQDPSRLKTCMAFELYEAAAVPASRCNYAHVTVNGEELGLYSNVEPVKKQLLRREFGEEVGNLYEGTLSDFRVGWTQTFEDEWGGSDRRDLEAVVDALEGGDPEELDAVVDVEAFRRAWALEALIGHWDSYTANTNNFYVYADPQDEGRFHFIPWGVDAVLQGEQPFGQYAPVSVTGESALAWSLYTTDDGPERYKEHLDSLLDEVWDEDHWLTRLEEMEDLTGPHLGPGEDRSLRRETIRAMESFIETRRGNIESEWSRGAPTIDDTLRSAICLAEQGTLELSFSTTFGSYGTEDFYDYGEGAFAVEVGGESYEVEFMSAILGEYEDGAAILFVSGQLETGEHIAYYALADTEVFDEAATHPVDWNTVTAYLLYDDGDLQEWQVWAYLGEGTLSLDEAGSSFGAAVSGSSVVGVYGG